jgi:hypothetical protein
MVRWSARYGDLVDDEAVVGVEWETRGHRRRADLDLPAQVVAASRPATRPLLNHETAGLGQEVGGVALLRHQRGGGRRCLLGSHDRSDRGQGDLGHHRAVDSHQLAFGVEVEPQLGTEHRHPQVLLAEAQVLSAEPVGKDTGRDQIADRVVEPERLAVAGEKAQPRLGAVSPASARLPGKRIRRNTPVAVALDYATAAVGIEIPQGSVASNPAGARRPSREGNAQPC